MAQGLVGWLVGCLLVGSVLDWLGTKLKSLVFGFFLDWVLPKRSQPVGSWKGKMLEPINFDVETILGYVLGTCMRCHKRKLIYTVPSDDKIT